MGSYCDFNAKFGIRNFKYLMDIGKRKEDTDKLIEIILSREDILYEMRHDLLVAFNERRIKFNNPTF